MTLASPQTNSLRSSWQTLTEQEKWAYLKRPEIAKHLKIPAKLELDAYAADPLALARRLGICLWWKQEDICRSVLQNKRTLVRAGFSTGKTFNAGLLIFWWFACYPDSICLTSAQTYSLLKDQLWAEVGGIYNLSLIHI